LKKSAPAIPSAKELDKPLASIRQEKPIYPYALQSDGISGKAEIEFIVDREGKACLPRIVSSTHDDFGWAAATAVERWRYQPPTKGGQKVDARTSVVVTFDLAKNTVTW
jgi:TonB family protein